MDPLCFQIENGDVKMYRGEAFCGNLGTVRPYSDDQLVRLLHRAVEIGEKKKMAEIQAVLGIRG